MESNRDLHTERDGTDAQAVTNLDSPSTLEEAQNEIQAQSILVRQEVYSAYSGPIPAPEQLALYANIDPSFPERIIRMAELEQASKTSNLQRLVDAEASSTKIITYSVAALPFAFLAFTAFGVFSSSTLGIIAGVVGSSLSATPAILNSFRNRK